MKKYFKNKFAFAIYIFVFAATIAMTLSGEVLRPCGAAQAAEENTFEVVFPVDSYFQCEKPTLIAANDKYLAVLDEATNKVYVRNKTENSTSNYDLKEVTAKEMYLVSSALVLHESESENGEGNNDFYLIDLAQEEQTLTAIRLERPEHISALTSDGYHLYAKSIGGNLSVFEFDSENKNLKVASEYNADDRYNADVLAGRAVLAAENGTLYLFSTDEKNIPQLYIYDVASDSKTKQVDTQLVQAAYAGNDVIFAQISNADLVENHGQVVCIDKVSGEVKLVSKLMPNNFCAYDDLLYTTEGDHINVYELTRSESGPGLVINEIISMSGSDDLHLDSPADIVQFDGKLAVADSGNSRIALIDSEQKMTEVALDSAAIRLAASKNELYALGENGEIFMIAEGIASEIAVLEGAIDIVYGDGLFALTSTGIYALQGNVFIRIANLNGAKRLAIADKGENLYALTNSGVEMFSKTGSRIATELSADLSEAMDLAVDFGGNIMAIGQKEIAIYANKLSSLEKERTIELHNSSAAATANSAALIGDTLYFTADECLVGKMKIDGAVTEQTFVPQQPVENLCEYSFIKLPQGNNAYALPISGRIDCAFNAPTETLLALDTPCPAGEGYVYAMNSNQVIIVPKTMFDTVDPETLTGEYVANVSTTLYKLPYFDEGTRLAIKGTHMTLMSDVAGYDGNTWRIVKVENETYFVKAEDIVKYIETIPEESRTFGKAKAERVGGLVGIYDSPSIDASKITEIVDGTKLEVLETYDAFYLVQCGDTVGYMLKDEVKIGVLTTVQIVSIVLSIFVLIAGTAIFVAIYITKQRLNNESQIK